MCYGSIVYWSVGLNRQAERFLLYLVVVLLTTFSAMSLGFFVGAVAPTALAAQALGPPVLIIFLLYGEALNTLPYLARSIHNLYTFCTQAL